MRLKQLDRAHQEVLVRTMHDILAVFAVPILISRVCPVENVLLLNSLAYFSRSPYGLQNPGLPEVVMCCRATKSEYCPTPRSG